MRFLYPRACNWILHKRNRDGTYTLKDCLCGCEYTLGPTIGFLWRNLDGRTDPGTILPNCSQYEVSAMMDSLEKEELIRHSRMYLAKVAMDITAKKMPADENGVRIAELDEMSYRRELWTHRPLTDFWMVGRGISKKLEDNYMFTMGDVARCSQYNEAKLYKLFGVNAELLIDRAWGREPTTIADVKAYRPSSNSLSMGQVLHKPYTYEMARVIVREMIDQHVLDMVEKGIVTDQIVMTIGYAAKINHALHKYPRVNSTEEIDRFMRSVKHESYYAEKKEK